jgi:hypothetical protein
MENPQPTNNDNKLQVLLHFIQDSQETIRFVEGKTAFCVAVFSGHIIVMYGLLDDLVNKASRFPFWYWFVLVVLLLLQLSFVYVVYRIIIPRFNPADGLNHDSINDPKLDLFLISSPKSSWHHILAGSGKIVQSFSKHLATLQLCTDEDLLTSVLYEFHKVSYIRNAKIGKLKVLTRLTLIASLFLIVILVLTAIFSPPLKH